MDTQNHTEDDRQKAPDLASTLEQVRACLVRFICFPMEAHYDIVTLWIAHTFLMDHWCSTPRLALISPEPGSGKTRVLEVMALLVSNPKETVSATMAYLVRSISSENRPTLLIDEFDTIFANKGPRSEEIRALLNAGYRNGASIGRCRLDKQNFTPEDLEAYCPVALAGLGGLPETISSRSICIRMKKRRHDEPVESLRFKTHSIELGKLKADLMSAINAVSKKISATNPQLPENITDREADIYEPLFVIAEAAGADWPKRVSVAAVALVADAQERGLSPAVALLQDIRKKFRGRDVVASAEIIERINSDDDSAWSSVSHDLLTTRSLARLLKDFLPDGCRSRNLRIGGKVQKGYRLSWLEDAWVRYLGAEEIPVTRVTSATFG